MSGMASITVPAWKDQVWIMEIIITIKDTATLSRIEELGNALHAILQDYGDVIAEIRKEW